MNRIPDMPQQGKAIQIPPVDAEKVAKELRQRGAATLKELEEIKKAQRVSRKTMETVINY